MTQARSVMESCDGLLLDLDGTLFRGGDAIPGAVDSVNRAAQSGISIRYVTNNASKTAEDVAAHLANLGFSAKTEQVSTSAQAGASMLASGLGPDSPVLVVGTEALRGLVREAGLEVARSFEDGPLGVIQGHSPHTCWSELAEACLALRAGAKWVACNEDVTLPAERGELPGNGAMVAALRAATTREPEVAGKPQRPLFDQAVHSAQMRDPLVVGDRLETDIAGANTADLPSVLVLTGACKVSDLLGSPAGRRPTYLALSVGELETAERISLNNPHWKVHEQDRDLVISGTDTGNDLAALATLCAHHWSSEKPRRIRADNEAARAALRRLGISCA